LTLNPLEHSGKMLQAVNHFKSFCSVRTRSPSLAISGSASEPGSATRRARVRTHGEKVWGSTSPPVLTRILSCAARFCSFSVGTIVVPYWRGPCCAPLACLHKASCLVGLYTTWALCPSRTRIACILLLATVPGAKKDHTARLVEFGSGRDVPPLSRGCCRPALSLGPGPY